MRFVKFPTWVQWEAASSTMMEKVTANQMFGKVQPKVGHVNRATALAIDDLVKRYHLVLDMSKLNILMELREAIVSWASNKNDREASLLRLAAMQALLDVTLRTMVELNGWNKHRYVKAACIGYEIKTGEYNPDKMVFDAANRTVLENADVRNSCVDLIGAIKNAWAAYNYYITNSGLAADDHKTLKIFMAPEFFFRGRYGAYQDIGLCTKILSTMREEIKDPRYADWLFVHGTAIFASEGKGGTFLENYALVQKGGVPTKTSDLVVAKEFPSHIDFKHPTVGDWDWYDPNLSEAKVAGKNVRHLSPVGGRADPIDNFSKSGTVPVSELVGGVIFTMDNITFGLEVCRDHFVGRLAHSKEAGKPLIQLIPSAGMGIDDASLGCKLDGIIFNVDGVTAHSKVKVRNAVNPDQCNNVRTEKHGNGLVQIYSSANIPWPAQAPLDVAQRLDITQGALSGTEPLRKVA